jgi:hypothetical protein
MEKKAIILIMLISIVPIFVSGCYDPYNDPKREDYAFVQISQAGDLLVVTGVVNQHGPVIFNNVTINIIDKITGLVPRNTTVTLYNGLEGSSDLLDKGDYFILKIDSSYISGDQFTIQLHYNGNITERDIIGQCTYTVI